jgi:mycothiol system anti-sigma-R factor
MTRMECSEITERLWQYLDGELAAKEAAAVDGHLDGCSGCRRHHHCDRAFLMLLARALSRPAVAPGSFHVAIRARLATVQSNR